MLWVLVVKCVIDWMFEIHDVDEVMWYLNWEMDCGVDLSLCMAGTCASMINGIELRWCLHYGMHCERLMVDES